MSGLKVVCLLAISAPLLTAVLAQTSFNGSLPIRIDAATVSGGANSRGSCPLSDVIKSARRNLDESARSSSQAFEAGEVLPNCGIGKWIHVALFNMSNASHFCPPSWTETSMPLRSCFTRSPTTCPGTFFSTSGLTYSRVCGRAIGLVSGQANAFGYLSHQRNQTIDGPYVDGISLTHGSPRKHIWTFAGSGNRVNHCPCDNGNRNTYQAPLPPSFIANDYFCDTVYNGALWDATGCTQECCRINTNPWFSVSLPAPTSDDIEVRICGDQDYGAEIIRLSYLQLYVQ